MAEFSEKVLDKADEALRLGRVRDDDRFPDLVKWVLSSDSTTEYRVQLIYMEEQVEWVTCTCPHGSNKGGGNAFCYHAAAVLKRLTDTEV